MPEESSQVESTRESRRHLLTRFHESMSTADGMVAPNNTEACANALIQDALDCGASDIHFSPNESTLQIRMRIDGALLDAIRLPLGQANRLVRHFKTLSGLDPSASPTPLVARRSLSMDGFPIDLRLATVPTVVGEKLVLRILDVRNIDKQISALGLSNHELDLINEWLRTITGMFLVTGPTGSGKTTTLYSLLHELKFLERSVVTIEDPVEYRIEGITQMQVDLRHGFTFDQGVRSMLRLDADYMLLGEIRDDASAQAAMEASGTGRTLLSTLHARDAVGAVTALRNWGLSDHEIASALEVVVAQRLVRKLCPACRRREPPTDAERIWLSSLGLNVPDETWHPVGCEECRNIGFAGRTGVFEVWRIDGDDEGLILGQADERTIRKHLSSRNHRPLLVDALSMVADGTTAIDELRLLGAFYVPPADALAAQLAGA